MQAHREALQGNAGMVDAADEAIIEMVRERGEEQLLAAHPLHPAARGHRHDD